MERARDQLLAGSGLAGNQHGRFVRTEQGYRLEDFAHLRGAYDHPAEPLRAARQTIEADHLMVGFMDGLMLLLMLAVGLMLVGGIFAGRVRYKVIGDG